LILKRPIIPKKYLLKNTFDTKISDLVMFFNKQHKKQLKVKWNSNSLVKSRIYSYNKLKGWKPNNSNIKDVINYIKF